MTKRVLDIGNCSPDHAAIAAMLQRQFAAESTPAANWNEARQLLAKGAFDLVLVNRRLDCDDSDGVEIIRQLKKDARLARLPVMMVTNFDEHQQRAIKVGAAQGFGKLEILAPETIEKLRPYLG